MTAGEGHTPTPRTDAVLATVDRSKTLGEIWRTESRILTVHARTLEAENERLRKALEQIVRRAFNEEPAEDLDDTQRDLRHIHATAVAALKEPK